MSTGTRIAGHRKYNAGTAHLYADIDAAAKSILANPETPHYCDFTLDHPTGAKITAKLARLVERDGALLAYTIGNTWDIARGPQARPNAVLTSFIWTTDPGTLPRAA